MTTNKVNLEFQVFGYYKGTKAAIEALSSVSEGSIAYATDTNEFGSYDGATWTWGQGGAGTLNSLSDVNITDLADGVLLQWVEDDMEWQCINAFLLFAPATEGVTNGNSHDHNGGDGAQINHNNLSNNGSSTGHVSNGDSHDHNGGDGGTIAHANLSGIGSNTHATIDSHLASTHLAFNDGEGDPADLALAAADGISSAAARRDHAHKGWVPVWKASDEAQQDNSLSADSDLQISTAAGTTYRIRGRIWFTTPAAADFKYRFRHTTAPTILWVKHKYTAPLAAAETEQAIENGSPTTTISVLSAGTVNDPGFIEFEALLITNTSGAFVFDWAQVTTTASDTKTKAGSYFEYQKV